MPILSNPRQERFAQELAKGKRVDDRKRFYVYRFDNEDGSCAYIGKGCGRRLEHQNRRFGKQGVIVRRFMQERAAFSYEAKLIAKLKPSMNKVAGGGGAISRFKRNSLPAWARKEFAEMEMVGTRVYAARFLLTRHGLERHVSPSQLSKIIEVANSIAA